MALGSRAWWRLSRRSLLIFALMAALLLHANLRTRVADYAIDIDAQGKAKKTALIVRGWPREMQGWLEGQPGSTKWDATSAALNLGVALAIALVPAALSEFLSRRRKTQVKT